MGLLEDYLEMVPYRRVSICTDDFSNKNIIGKFQFDKLYHGVIDYGSGRLDPIVVKVWENPNACDVVQAENERHMMIAGEDGQKKWKRVEVNFNEHVKFPRFPQGMSPDYYDDCLSNYLTKLGMEDFPPQHPLWEIHVMNYPTTNAAGNIVSCTWRWILLGGSSSFLSMTIGQSFPTIDISFTSV